MLDFFKKVIYLAVLGLHHCSDSSLVVESGGSSLVALHRLLIVVASLGEHRLWGTGSIVVAHGLKMLQGTWDLPRSGMETVSPALAGKFFTTEPPGKSLPCYFNTLYS